MDTIIDNLETASGTWYVQMVEEDGTWTLDSSDFKSKAIIDFFAEGRSIDREEED